MRPAIAIRWITALVEPPIAALARIAFSNACARQDLATCVRSSWTISTMRRPAMRASTLRRASTAGIGGVARQADAQRLDHAGHGRGGAHGHAVAVASGACTLSASRNSSSVIVPARTSSRMLHTPVPEPRSLAAALAVEHRPAGHADGRQVARWPRPSAAPAWSCRSPSAARRRRAGCRGSIPRRPCWRGCGTASRWAAAASRRATSPGTRAGSRRPRRRRVFTCSASVAEMRSCRA